jgi:hypothetical protein
MAFHPPYAWSDKYTVDPPKDKGGHVSILGPKLPWINLRTEVGTDPTNPSSSFSFNGSGLNMDPPWDHMANIPAWT